MNGVQFDSANPGKMTSEKPADDAKGEEDEFEKVEHSLDKYRVLLCGDEGAGKASLAIAFFEEHFPSAAELLKADVNSGYDKRTLLVEGKRRLLFISSQSRLWLQELRRLLR